MIKKCKYCRREFETTCNRQIYCNNVHYYICPVCGQTKIVKSRKILSGSAVACSEECKRKKIVATSIERYGIATPGNSKEAREKSKETMMKKYGVPYASMNSDILKKIKKTNLEKYGAECFLHSDYYLQKSNKDQIFLLTESAAINFFRNRGIETAARIQTSFFGIVNDKQITCAVQVSYERKYNCVRIDAIAKNNDIKEEEIDRILDFLYQTYYYDILVAEKGSGCASYLVSLSQRYDNIELEEDDNSIIAIIN